MTAPNPKEHGKASLDAIMPKIYQELHRVAASFMRHERGTHTLQPTALVNETYLRLISQHNVDFQNRPQVLGIAAQMMRRILSTHEEKRRTAKRGGEFTLVCLDESSEFLTSNAVSFTVVNEILDRLAALDKRQAMVAELRIFGGLTVPEAAEFLEVSHATISRDWFSAKLWLTRELNRTKTAASTLDAGLSE
jgi:RNA polymerase sigma-70 factor (ECF subfamily)